MRSKKNHKGKGKGLFNRDDQGITPYNLRDCAYISHFDRQKIVYQKIVQESKPNFYLDMKQFYIEASAFILTGDDLKYLLGCLNSRTIAFIFKELYAGGGLGPKGYRYKKKFLKLLPIPKITASNREIADKITLIVDQILILREENPKADTTNQEETIDKLVCQLYDLTQDEIAIIEA